MRTAVIAAAISTLFVLPAVAADIPQQLRGPGPNFEQRRSEILKRIDERIARIQEEKSCVQAAKNHEDLKACRDKFKAEIQEQRQKQR